MTGKLKAPKLPDGYFFVVAIDKDGDVRITLKRRGLLTSKELYVGYVTASDSYPRNKLPESIHSKMQRFADKLQSQIIGDAELKRYVGTYPPREYITGGDE